MTSLAVKRLLARALPVLQQNHARCQEKVCTHASNTGFLAGETDEQALRSVSVHADTGMLVHLITHILRDITIKDLPFVLNMLFVMPDVLACKSAHAT